MTEYQILISACFSLLSAIIASGLTGWITYKFAIKRHRSERMWEIKAETYQKLIQSLHRYIRSHKSSHNAVITYSNLSDDYKEKMDRFAKDSYDHILEVVDSSNLILSKKTNLALRDWYEKTESHNNALELDFFEYYEIAYTDAEELLSQIIDYSKNDLKR